MYMIFHFYHLVQLLVLIIYGKKDELVPFEDINELNKRLSAQKGIKVEFDIVSEANHFFSKADAIFDKIFK